MGIIEKIEVDDATMQWLEQAARRHGRSISAEAAERLRVSDAAIPAARADLIERSRQLRASLPPQKSDGLQLLREDRDR